MEIHITEWKFHISTWNRFCPKNMFWVKKGLKGLQDKEIQLYFTWYFNNDKYFIMTITVKVLWVV